MIFTKNIICKPLDVAFLLRHYNVRRIQQIFFKNNFRDLVSHFNCKLKRIGSSPIYYLFTSSDFNKSVKYI